MTRSRAFRPCRSHHGERGVALLVALVVLVIIGLMSASIMRGALSSDLIANNTRVQTMAAQAAQIGLRYCEDQGRQNVPGITVLPAAATEAEMAWHTYGSWGDVNIVNEVPSDRMTSEYSTFAPAKAPQCIAQQMVIGGAAVLQVTARGFSPDYSADETGFTSTGSVVWLQSIVSL